MNMELTSKLKKKFGKKSRSNKKEKKRNKFYNLDDDSASDPDELSDNEVDALRQRRQQQEELEKALVEGTAGGMGDEEQLQSPDDVTILVTQEGGPGTKVQILIQLEESKSTLRVLGESFVTSMTESVKRKYSYIYIIALLLGLGFLSHMIYMLVKQGAPVTADSRSAMLRLFVSLGIMIIISPMAFFIINLRISNLSLGVFWMFAIVSLLYFTSTALSASAYFIHKYNKFNSNATKCNSDERKAMASVYEFVSTYYKNDYELKDHKFLKAIAEKEECCDYVYKCSISYINKNQSQAMWPATTLWDAVFINDTVKPNNTNNGTRPKYCCPNNVTKVGDHKCHANFVHPRMKKKCDVMTLLKSIRTIMIFTLIYTCIMSILCIAMALVFWYYYSDLKAREFSLEEQPGDFALLNIHRPHREGQTIELTIREKLKRQRKKRRLSKLREKYKVDRRHKGHRREEEEETTFDEELDAPAESEFPDDEDNSDEDDDDDGVASSLASSKHSKKSRKSKGKAKGSKHKKRGKHSKKGKKTKGK